EEALRLHHQGGGVVAALGDRQAGVLDRGADAGPDGSTAEGANDPLTIALFGTLVVRHGSVLGAFGRGRLRVGRVGVVTRGMDGKFRRAEAAHQTLARLAGALLAREPPVEGLSRVANHRGPRTIA